MEKKMVNRSNKLLLIAFIVLTLVFIALTRGSAQTIKTSPIYDKSGHKIATVDNQGEQIFIYDEYGHLIYRQEINQDNSADLYNSKGQKKLQSKKPLFTNNKSDQ
jgi:hypothetical protein